MKDRNPKVEDVEIDVLQQHQHAYLNQPQRRPDGGYARPIRHIQSPDDSSFSQGWGSSTHTLQGTQFDSRPPSPPWLSGQITPNGPQTPMSGRFSPSLNSRPSSYMYQSNASQQGLLSSPPAPVYAHDWVKQGSIARLHDRDDVDIWKGWRRHVFRLVPFLTVANAALYLTYLGLRIACVVLAQRAADIVYIQAWIFVAIEFIVAVPPLMHNTWTLWALKKRKRPKMRLVGGDLPTVDVFITCCKEDDDVIMDTVRATCDIDYPRDRFRVILLDDGRSKVLEDFMANLAVSQPNTYYIARPKPPGVPHHFKAGNLNYGLDAVHNLPGGAGKYMAALDADMIPERDWLRAVLPHLLADPKVALACPPQLFYNTPPSDPLSQSLDFFVHVIEPIKDAMGVAWCTGSGYVVRRDALDEIGNFPLGSLAEDVATSTLMLGKGWKTAYIHEPLQFGTVPEDYASHLKQRTRWAIGTVDTSIKLKFCLWGKAVRQMSFAQRFSGFLYATLNLYTVLLTISLFAIPIILVMGKPLVAYANDDQLRWLVRACFAAMVSNRLCEATLFIPAGYRTGRRGARYELWMSPYISLCLIRAFVLPRWLGGQAQAFNPTGSISSKLNERSSSGRKNMLRRLWSIMVTYLGGFHLAFVYLTLVGVVLSSFRCFAVNFSTKEILFCLVTHAFWPPLTFLFICSAIWTPISYAIDPPTMPDRETLLDRDPKTSVAHPTARSKKIAFTGQDAWFEMEYAITTAYTALVFVASFIF